MYYKGAAGNRINFLPGLDIKSTGGYVICPGSAIGGKRYEFFGPEHIPDLPPWLREIAGKPRERAAEASVPVTDPDQPSQVEAAVDYLEFSAPIAIEGQAGDSTTYQVACKTRDLGLSEDRTRELMAIHWNPRCEPPWDEDELARKVQNAYTYARDQQGNETPEGRMLEAAKYFTNIEPPAEELEHFLISEIGLAHHEQKWIAHGWFPAGPAKPSLFTGAGATGKSLLALQLGMSVASGIPWLNVSVTKMRVFFVTCEDDKDELDNRMWNIRQAAPDTYGRMPSDTPMHVIFRVGHDSVLCIEQNGRTAKGPFWKTLNGLLQKYPGPKLLMIDTVADVYAGDESNRSGVTTFLKANIGELAMRNNATPILLAHPPKSNHDYSGSTAWHNSVRNRVYLEHPDPDARGIYRTMTNRKSNSSAGNEEMTLMWKNWLFVPVDRTELQSVQDSAVQSAINAAASAGEPLAFSHQSPRYIGKTQILDCEGKPMTGSAIRDIVNRLIASGIVRNVSGAKHGNGLFTT
jgi:hypothetical protein